MNNRKLVQAIAIDFNNIYTLCCNTECPEHIHKYGSNRDLSDRMEFRCSHCPCDNTEIKIRIDETTKRCKLNYYITNRSITFSNRDFRRQRRAIALEEENEKFQKLKKAYREALKNNGTEIIYNNNSKEPFQVRFD